jgi:hypothetical protein
VIESGFPTPTAYPHDPPPPLKRRDQVVDDPLVSLRVADDEQHAWPDSGEATKLHPEIRGQPTGLVGKDPRLARLSSVAMRLGEWIDVGR